jgi:hypothetical protein
MDPNTMSDTNTEGASAPSTGSPMTDADAAKVFASVLADEAPRKRADTPKEETDEAPQAPVEAADDADEPEADATEDGDEPEAVAQSDDDDEPETAPKEPQKVRLDDGTEVTLDELRKSYLRQSDYTRKTQEVAAQRAATEQRLTQLTQVEQHLQRQLQQAAAIMQRNLPPPPDPELREIDPIGYLMQKENHEKAIAELNALGSQWHQSQERVRHAQMEQLGKIKIEAVERLEREFPEIKDPAKREAFKKRVYKAATEIFNFSVEEMDRAYDDRAYKVMHYAEIGYNYVHAKKPTAQVKVKEAPPVQKAGRRATPTETERGRMKDRMQNLRQTGSEAAAAAIFRSLI